LLLLCSVAFAVAGCGVPMGKDISSGAAGGNSIKLDKSCNNVIVLTDGQLNPADVIEKAGKIIIPIAPLPQTIEIKAAESASPPATTDKTQE